jgi:addiction module HigA family antidote
MSERRIQPVHPGEIIAEDILEELGMTSRQLAEKLSVPTNRMSEIVRGRRAITADTALRLARWLGGDASFWLDLQKRYDLETAMLANGDEIDRTVKPRASEAA